MAARALGTSRQRKALQQREYVARQHPTCRIDSYAAQEGTIAGAIQLMYRALINTNRLYELILAISRITLNIIYIYIYIYRYICIYMYIYTHVYIYKKCHI